jgi:hypothetical protein
LETKGSIQRNRNVNRTNGWEQQEVVEDRMEDRGQIDQTSPFETFMTSENAMAGPKLKKELRRPADKASRLQEQEKNLDSVRYGQRQESARFKRPEQG